MLAIQRPPDLTPIHHNGAGTLPRLTSQLLPFTVVDLFSGAGGMTSGFWQKGFQLRGAVDRQVGKPGETVPCNETYYLNFGVKPMELDLETTNPEQLRRRLGLRVGQLSVLVSCPPCTGYSQKRYQNLQEDDRRNALVARTGEFVAAFKPQFLVMENVPEMVRGPFSHHFEALYNRLERLGYRIWVEIVDFYNLGLPQHRRRALVIARRSGQSVPDIRARVAANAPRTVRQALSQMPDLPDDRIRMAGQVGRRAARVLQRCQLIRRKGGRWTQIQPETLTPDELELLTERIRGALAKGDRKTYPDCYGTIRPDEASPTLIRQCGDIGTGPWFHWEHDRMLTAREMAVLQGFPYGVTPDGTVYYQFAGPLGKVYQQIGNAVPPLISGMIAEGIAGLLLRGEHALPQERIRPLAELRKRR